MVDTGVRGFNSAHLRVFGSCSHLEYLLAANRQFLIVCFVVEVAYFWIADKYNIIDKPNERSSHTKVTLRGGGIIFYAGMLAYFLTSGFAYPWFMLGLTGIAAVSEQRPKEHRSCTAKTRFVFIRGLPEKICVRSF